ncbi:MAG: hypothetical protein J7530_01290 [Novosphingobium sp.]|nr:hypothetical protein [Novosphingobium sp.]
MSTAHEYAILGGYNRTKVGRYLSQISAAISGILVFLVLSISDIAKIFGLNVNVPPVVMSLVGAGMVYLAVHWFFDKHVWKIDRVSKILKLPNLDGVWHCEGVNESKTPPENWTGTVTIVQSWEKIRINLQTEKSSSNSVAAAIVDESPTGFLLMYHYKNEPKHREVDMSAHHGFTELTFSSDGLTAYGGYFNGRGRNTYGTMKLIKEGA